MTTIVRVEVANPEQNVYQVFEPGLNGLKRLSLTLTKAL